MNLKRQAFKGIPVKQLKRELCALYQDAKDSRGYGSHYIDQIDAYEMEIKRRRTITEGTDA